MDHLESALNCDRSIFIQACAGAGKTYALTKRYAAILDNFAKKIEQGEDPNNFDHRQILVITFTKKATGEMNRRIYEDVNILLSGNKPKGMEERDFCPTLRKSKDKNVRIFTQRLKDTFSQNSISTIDSFCAGILREFAHKLGLDPQFLSQDEHDAKRLLSETLDTWLSEKLELIPRYFDTLLEELSFYQIKEILKSMYGSREVLDDYISDFEKKSEDQIWKEWLMSYTPTGLIENLVDTYNALWKELEALCTNKDDDLYIGLKEFYKKINELDESHPQEYRAFLISDVIRKSIFVTKSGTYIKRWKGKENNWSDKRELIKDWFQNLKNTISEEDLLITPGPQDKKIIPLLKSLIESYRDFDKYFYNIRMDRDLLDFSDVIILTHKLIKENEDVRNILGKRYRHIMLDEFQDTNPLRWQIIEMILNAGKDIKLFIVGDRKQSIYRFNNADVTVMNTAQHVIESLGGAPIDFNDNYRSSQTFIDQVINPLMSMILKKPEEPKEDYEADFKETRSPFSKEGLTSTLQCTWCEHAKDEEEYIPAYHTAYQVRHLLEEHENSKIDEDKDKPLIAVLLRRGTKIPEYLQAFHKLGISVEIFGGKDFYMSTALNDIFHFISVLDNPLDEQSLIGLLRSPFFALPDPLINLLADRGETTVFDAMSSIPELQNTYHEILTWKELSKTQALDELISTIMDSDDRELAYVSELMPEQQLANFDKALNIIRGLQRNGSTLRELREFLYYQIRTQADESQAIYPGKARVQILTVHKAKGLEFPIVVIPEMNSKGNSSKDKFRYGKHENRPEITLSLGDDEKPGMLMRLKEITKKEEEAEDKRVFYVAVTRAIHKVLLLGEGEKALANSWWTKYVLGISGDPKKEDLLVQNWTSGIDVLRKEKVMPDIIASNAETRSWKEKELFDEPGKYLYRSPHDLMGDNEEFTFENVTNGLGNAPGNIFHYCMEKSYLDTEKYKNEIKAYLSERYPELPEQDIIAKLKPWLDTTKAHELADILLDPDIEKYPELKVKAWLGNDRDIVQVNGSIDLLYKQNGQWVILDYKTDASKRLLSIYKKQLQSYQWMLKQAYNIDAAAKLYFVSLNEVEEIEWDEDYFNELPLSMHVEPKYPISSMDLSNLIPEIKEGKQLILCASAQHEEQVYLAMAKKGLLRPDIKISTLSNFVHESGEEGISMDKLRLMIKHRNPDMKNGTADLLAKALRSEELLKGHIKSEFLTYYKDIPSLPGYRSAAHPYDLANARGRRVILLDVYAETELEKALIKKLKSETDVCQLSLSPDEHAEKYTLLESFSPREEVLAVAKHIKENCRETEQVMIAVASMEKYAPHLKRQFPQMGLQVRFIGPRALYELPCIGLLMNYLKLCARGVKDWSELAPVLLHPLMKNDDHYYHIDKSIRQEPMKEKAVPQTDLTLCRKSSDLLKTLKEFSEGLKTDNDTDTCKACDKFLEILEKVINDLTLINPQTDILAIFREMSQRIITESIPRKDQWNGIPVVGLLDSLGVNTNKLYVLGMVEGDIPRQENENPFFNKNRNYSLELNKHFVDEWLKLGEKVIFSTSTHAEDGSEQNRSSFLEDVKLKVIRAEPSGRREKLLKYAGRNIQGADTNLIERHHEILNKTRDKYSGNTGLKQKGFNISVTQVDKLLACPMRFYFDTIIKCYPMDQEEALYWGSKKGNVVHKAFEYFIERNGYELEIENALSLMDECLTDALEHEKINIDDPLQMDHFRQYVKGLTEGSDKNCLAVNLSIIKKDFDTYSKIESEKKFENLKWDHPELDIMLKGRIDKIMIDEDEKKLITSDFKTGTLTTSLLSKMMLSQLYLYLKYCNTEYPGYELRAMYEKLKDPKDCKMVQYAIMEDDFKQLGGRTIQSFDINDFNEHLNDLFSEIGAGKYYITEKDYSKTCKYCPHIGLCRRDSRLKIKENSHE